MPFYKKRVTGANSDGESDARGTYHQDWKEIYAQVKNTVHFSGPKDLGGTGIFYIEIFSTNHG
jgi:hypothetical protein